jgi:hypothetical protein
MFHLVARTRDRSPLWSDWEEGAALWERVTHAVPGLVALVLMPDHVHLLHPTDARLPLGDALGRHVRWRHARHGTAGDVLARLPPAEPLTDAQKVRRSIRYVHLNPCRARLVTDPLAWPFSTHRDALGCAVRPVIPRARDPEAFHRYVSADPTVDVRGSALPARALRVDSPAKLAEAVSAALRVPLEALRRRGPARATYLALAQDLCPDASAEDIAHEAGVSRSTVYAAALQARPDARDPVRACAGDERLRALVGPVPGRARG